MGALSVVSRVASRVKSWFDGPNEGQWRGPFYGIGELGHWFGLGQKEDGYQRNLRVPHIDGRRIPAAYACVMTTARAISQCYPMHRMIDAQGNVSVITTSPAARVFRTPNNYETWPQFILNMVANLGFDGESFAIARRDAANRITALHRVPKGAIAPYVAWNPMDTANELYYTVGANPMVPDMVDWMIPASDVLHLRSYCPRHPLIGESALAAAAMAAGINVALSASQLTFFSRMSRPSGVLSSDVVLTGTQIAQLRESWKEQAKGINQGEIPILGGGMKWQPMVISSQDAQLIEAQRLSIEDIARVYGVPLPVIGDLSHATLQNTEQLIQHWLSMSLGSTLENLERSFDVLFGFGANEYTELDIHALLRADFEKRIEGLTKAIQQSLMTPDEARAREGLSPAPDGVGNRLYGQAQVQPLGQPLNAAAVADPANDPAADDPDASAEQRALDKAQRFAAGRAVLEAQRRNFRASS
jgi:HK97 family phage portal protein